MISSAFVEEWLVVGQATNNGWCCESDMVVVSIIKNGWLLVRRPTTAISTKNYIVHALTMLNYLKSSFGTSATNTIHLESAPNAPLTKTQIINALNGKQGIYALIPVDPSKATGFGASGHIDLLDKDGTLVSGHNYFFANGGVKEIYLFILD